MEKIKALLRNKAVWLSAAAVVVAVAVVVTLVLLGGNTNNDPGNTEPAGDVNFTVQVSTDAGRALANVDVFVYADATLEDLVAVAKTGADGVAAFTAPDGVYAAVLAGVPAGYPLDANYPIIDAQTKIVLQAKLITDADLNKDTFDRNGVMFDFSVTDTEGNTYELSQLLKQKKAVVLNFWYTTCEPCKGEFPYLQEAYEAYSDDIALIAVNPLDTAEKVAQFRTEQGLTIPMASVDPAWEKAFSISAYPTTMVIDRFGNINFLYVGPIDNTELFESVFAYYAAEEYTQQEGLALSDFAEAAPEGTENNPFEFGSVTEFEVTVQPGQSVYVDLYRVTNMIMTIEDETISVLYNDTTYVPEEGVLAMVVSAPDTYSPAKLLFTNTGAEEKTYKAVLTYPAGSMGNPHKLELGEVTVDIPAGADQGVYYTYIAQASGELTLKCVGGTDSVEYTYTLYNLNTYVYKSFDADSQNGMLVIEVNEGDEVQFTAGTIPMENNEYPAATLKFAASFEEKEVNTPHPTEPEETLPTETVPTEPSATTPANPKPTDPTEPTINNGEYVEIYDGEIIAYHFAEGSKTVGLTAGDLTYFLFTPERAGQFRFTTGVGTIAYYGTNLHYVSEQTDSLEGATDTSFVINIKEGNLGGSYLIAITAPAGTTKGNLEIKRIGEPVLGWEDMPYTVYNGTHTPVAQTAPTGTMTYINVAGKVENNTPVLGSDGFYYLNGKLLYVNLIEGKYPEMALNTKLLGDYPFIRGTVKDANGTNVAKEEYTELVLKYIECAADGFYPLTEDLMRILKTQGDNWYLYLTSSVRNPNKDLAWMCNVCYAE